MSRRKQIEKAGAYLGLYAGHAACFGEGWRESGHYWRLAAEILRHIKLSESERALCRSVAVARARRYVVGAYAVPAKTKLPATKDAAMQLAEASIDAALRSFQGD